MTAKTNRGHIRRAAAALQKRIDDLRITAYELELESTGEKAQAYSNIEGHFNDANEALLRIEEIFERFPR